MDLAGVLAVCLIAAATLWNKLDSLLWLDPAWWLHETLRFARGEAPYRDFFWQYPPLGLAVVGYPLRYVGINFSVAQVVMDSLSLAIVLLMFCLLGYLVPRSLRVWICVLLIAVGATTQTYFSLFSLLSYSPSLHTATIGLLLMLLGCCRYLANQDGGARVSKATLLLLVTGCWIALLSKQEAMLAAAALLATLALCDPWEGPRLWRWSPILAAAFVPPFLVYLLLAQAVGFGNLFTALSGYGLATMPCPWWPTGLGVFGALAALGAAVFLVGAGSLLEASRWRARLSARYLLLLLAAACGAAVWSAYEWYSDGALLTQAAPLFTRLSGFAKAALSTSSVLRPVLWSALFYSLALLGSAVRGRLRLCPARLQLLLILIPPVLIGIRSLFGSTLAPFPEVPALDYPFLLILGPYLLVRALECCGEQAGRLIVRGDKIPLRITIALILCYAVTRIVGGYPDLLSNRTFGALATESGTVRVRDRDTHAAIYRYVLEHTQPGDAILELPYGGGMTFATRRHSPVFGTLFAQVPTPAFVQLRDLERVQADLPRVVIAMDERHFGTWWGIRGNMACVFPRWTWVPDKPSWDPALVLPMVEFIQTHYRTDRKIGEWLMLLPNDPAALTGLGIPSPAARRKSP
jgi:hypothetical protein